MNSNFTTLQHIMLLQREHKGKIHECEDLKRESLRLKAELETTRRILEERDQLIKVKITTITV